VSGKNCGCGRGVRIGWFDSHCARFGPSLVRRKVSMGTFAPVAQYIRQSEDRWRTQPAEKAADETL